MKNFPANFAAQKDLKTGAAPVWIFKLSAGGVDYYISDNAFNVTPWGVTTRAWVKGWGSLSEGVSGTIDEFKISEFSVSCFADPDASPNIADLALNYDLEVGLCYLYFWYQGCADPPQEFFRGYVRDYPLSQGDTICTLQVQDETLKWERTYVGNKVTRELYPNADPDDVGRIIPIPYGTVKGVPARAVNAGLKTSLPATIGAATTVFSVSSGDGLTAGMVLQVDDEQILVNSVAGDSISDCTRGYNGTLAASHLSGAVVWERRASFDYLFSDVPVDAAPKVYAMLGDRKVDVTSVCTVYLGTVGNQHPSYPAKGVVTMPGYVTASQSVDLLVNDGISINDALAIVDNIAIADNIGVLSTLSVADTVGILSTLGLNDAIAIASTLGVTDTISILNSIAPSDTIQVLDALGLSDTISIADTLTISDIGHQHEENTNIRQLWPTWSSYSGPVSNSAALVDDDPATIANCRLTGPTAIVYVRHETVEQGPPAIAVRAVIVSGTASGAIGSAYIRTANNDHASPTIPVPPGSTVYTDWIPLDWGEPGIDGWRMLRTAGTLIQINGPSPSGILEIDDVYFEVKMDVTTTNVMAAINRSGGVSKTGSVTRSGGVTKSGTVTLTGTVNKNGTVSLTGGVSKTGSASLTGGVSKTGSASLTGGVSKTGSVTRSGGVTRTGGVTKSGSVTLAGNSVANTLVGEGVYVDVFRNVTAPGDVVAEILSTWCKVTSFRLVGNFPASYAFNGAIVDYRLALDVVHDLAWQCRAWFRHSLGAALLLVRDLNPVPVKTVSVCRVENGRRVHSRGKTPYGEIINKIELGFDRDWSQDRSSTAYRGVSKDLDQQSIDKFGLQERPELFLCDFITSQEMADDVRAFYLAYHSVRHWVHTYGSYYNDCELEFGDGVVLGFAGNVSGQVLAPELDPATDTMQLKVII